MRNYVRGRDSGLCQECLRNGIFRAGTQVDHIVPIEDDWGQRLDPENCELKCDDCHNKKHGRESQLQKFMDIWEDS